jgi:hypothetical protein
MTTQEEKFRNDHMNAAFKGASSVRKSTSMPPRYERIEPEEEVQKLTPLTLREAVEFWAAPVAIVMLLAIGLVGMFW